MLFFRQEKEKKRGTGCMAFEGPVSNEWNISLFTGVQESSASLKSGTLRFVSLRLDTA